MKLKNNIRTAWDLTLSHPFLRWFSFIPSFFATLVGLGWLIYQFTALSERLFGFKINYSETFGQLWTFFQKAGGQWSIIALILVIFVLLGYLLLVPLFQGGLIVLLDKIHHKQPTGFLKGISYGLFNYLPYFEFRAVLGPFSTFTVISLILLVYRIYGPEAVWFFLPVFIVIFIFTFIVSFFLSFADFFLILKKKSIASSLRLSASLVALNFTETALMMILMILIGIRVLANIGLLLLAPLAVLFALAYFSSLALGNLGLLIAFLLGFGLIIFAAYLNSLISIFTTAVWLITFHSFYSSSSEELEK